jgi:hypothetical protein
VTEDEARAKLKRDPNFVYSKRHDYSLAKLEERYPDGVPDNVIAAVLMIPEDKVDEEFEKVVAKMRGLMGVEL